MEEVFYVVRAEKLKRFQNNREVSRSWAAVNQEHEAVMERSSTESTWEFSSVREAVRESVSCKSAAEKRRLYV
jgi:hypothetical protein